MKQPISLVSCFVVVAVLLFYRFDTITPSQPLKITLWDANGYYLYLPALLIYHDYKELNWLADIDRKYAVTGGDGYQAQKADNGSYVFKYLGGVALMELPFFYAGHAWAKWKGYPPDGFSPPYQYALGLGIIAYSLLALLVLRRVLLYYFTDRVAAFTLLLLCLATNFIQYAAVDSGQSHAYIFLLYALLLYATYQWHQKPTLGMAALIGLLCGLATISRPTEAIIIFIPIFWNTYNREAAKAKWALVRRHKVQIASTIVGGLFGVLPQLLYWKAATGSWVYDVGSKWRFLDPWFRVLFGFEKGWFVYTPITLFFIAGMWFMRNYGFKKSVLWFCLLNIYIIIAWDDWRYGGSYSTRALVQSYPVFALPLAAAIKEIGEMKWLRWLQGLMVYLLCVNLFQVRQYCSTVLHFNDMNRQYYSHIYLNAHPTPLDMSYLDNSDELKRPGNYQQRLLLRIDSPVTIHTQPAQAGEIANLNLPAVPNTQNWLKLEANITVNNTWLGYVYFRLQKGNQQKTDSVRLYRPLAIAGAPNRYAFWFMVPDSLVGGVGKVYVASPNPMEGSVQHLTITHYYK